MSDEAQMDLDLPEETVVEVEATETPEVEVVEEQKADDNFDKAQTSTQKRIDRLTKKMREAERREQEAINYAKQVQTEAQTIKQRMDALDTSYVLSLIHI